MTQQNSTVRPHFDPFTFGKRLRDARKSRGITQEELAERISVDRNHITRMERGIRVCSIDLLVEMACALGVSTDYLLLGATPTDIAKNELLTVIEQLSEIAQRL